MRENRSLYFNTALHSLFLFILCAVQSGLWYRLFNGFPQPFFWVLFLTYISLYRDPQETFFLAAFSFLVVSSFSLIPHGSMFLVGFFICMFCMYIKDRIFWPGPSYYLLIASICSVAANIIYYLLVFLFEETSAPDIRWLYIFLQCLLTTLISPILYFIYQILDKLSGKEQYIPMDEVG